MVLPDLDRLHDEPAAACVRPSRRARPLPPALGRPARRARRRAVLALPPSAGERSRERVGAGLGVERRARPDPVATAPRARVVAGLLSGRWDDHDSGLVALGRPLVPVRLFEPRAARGAGARRLVAGRRRVEALPPRPGGLPPSRQRASADGSLPRSRDRCACDRRNGRRGGIRARRGGSGRDPVGLRARLPRRRRPARLLPRTRSRRRGTASGRRMAVRGAGRGRARGARRSAPAAARARGGRQRRRRPHLVDRTGLPVGAVARRPHAGR
jgi:hypothetical protein